MQTEDMHLDGNSAAGALRELFAREVTDALATCSGCGRRGMMGELLEYGHAMGVVLRCPTCDTVVMRIARTPGYLRVDVTGLSFLSIPESAH